MGLHIREIEHKLGANQEIGIEFTKSAPAVDDHHQRATFSLQHFCGGQNMNVGLSDAWRRR